MIICVVFLQRGKKKQVHSLFLSNTPTKPVNKSKTNTAKGNRERLGPAKRPPARQEVNTGRKCHLNHSRFLCAIINTRQDQRNTQIEPPAFQCRERPPLATRQPCLLTRKYFCLSSFSWKADPNTAICPSYLVPFCQSGVKSKSNSVKPKSDSFHICLVQIIVYFCLTAEKELSSSSSLWGRHSSASK